MAQSTVADLVERHRPTLEAAVAAAAQRGYWSAYPESPSPKVYGETAAAEGLEAYQAYLGKPFPIDQPSTDGWVGSERSPFGPKLGVTYPHPEVDALLAAMKAALPAWRDAGPETRAAVCIEIVDRLNKRSFELANAIMHTSGQAFVMSFQAGGTHAQDRALEAIAYGYAEMTRHAGSAYWEKPQGKRDPLKMTKTFHPVPRGIALVIGCNTFPTWNSYPGLFASLVTGNPVVVKPHPRAVLPLAITVAVGREVLAESGFDPNLMCLAAEADGEGLATVLATHHDVKIVDFTGSSQYGNWLEQHARQAQVYTEKAGVNTVVVDSTDDWRGMLGNIAFSLVLYSGQMCTTPQNFLVPRDGIQTDDGHKSFDEVAAGISVAVDNLTGDEARAVELLGAIVNQGVLDRLAHAEGLGSVVRPSATLTHPSFPDAVVRTPLLVALDAKDEEVYAGEHFGPISFVIATDSTEQSLEIFRRTVGTHGALTASVYSTREPVLEAAEDAAIDVGVALSCNLNGGVFVNQSAAFSDFHGTGANPACNAALTDGAFVAGRFRIVQSRRHV
ncbi:MAG: phenylacetic acid degradation protein PaaN [Sporichthyaceae bacterium]|nr:phenylacetic acid degradation protein PaaN [Sporichthyaceae bacterium]